MKGPQNTPTDSHKPLSDPFPFLKELERNTIVVVKVLHFDYEPELNSVEFSNQKENCHWKQKKKLKTGMIQKEVCLSAKRNSYSGSNG